MRKRDDAKEEAIVEAAIRLINEHGFAQVSMSKIAKAAGVSPATIYIYFENKEDLLNKLYLFVKSHLVENFQNFIDAKLSWEENFNRAYELAARYMVDNRSYMSFMEQCSTNPLITDATRSAGLSMFREITTFFKMGIEDGEIHENSAEVAMTAVFGPLWLASNMEHGEMMLENQDYLSQLRECAWRAIRK